MSERFQLFVGIQSVDAPRGLHEVCVGSTKNVVAARRALADVSGLVETRVRPGSFLLARDGELGGRVVALARVVGRVSAPVTEQSPLPAAWMKALKKDGPRGAGRRALSWLRKDRAHWWSACLDPAVMLVMASVAGVSARELTEAVCAGVRVASKPRSIAPPVEALLQAIETLSWEDGSVEALGPVVGDFEVYVRRNSTTGTPMFHGADETGAEAAFWLAWSAAQEVDRDWYAATAFPEHMLDASEMASVARAVRGVITFESVAFYVLTYGAEEG